MLKWPGDYSDSIRKMKPVLRRCNTPNPNLDRKGGEDAVRFVRIEAFYRLASKSPRIGREEAIMPVAFGRVRLDGVRAFFAALLILAPFLQPLMSTPAGRTALQRQGIYSIICNQDPSADHAPGKRAVPFKEHCLLCALQVISAPVRFVLTIVLAVGGAEIRDASFSDALDDAPPVLSGWSSSWSSQGPPFFS